MAINFVGKIKPLTTQLSIDVGMILIYAFVKVTGVLGLSFMISYFLIPLGIHVSPLATVLMGFVILYLHSLYVDLKQQVIWTMNTHAHLEIEKNWTKLTTEDLMPKSVPIPVKVIAPPKKPEPPTWNPILPGEE